jgi:Capsule polysaccharide biosynthesis protein
MDGSDDLRTASIVLGCDCWPAIANVLAGVAFLQFPWSARAMDEAGAVFDALKPEAALTYAEAGGWGRALVLEARRRGIPIVGLQHGFIYRHWLNYRHEPDEMRPLPAPSSDTGFPLPTRTLVFDEYAASHLRDAGRFPEGAIEVTGSPRLDQLATTFASQSDDDIAAARAAAGATDAQALAVLVTKYTEARTTLPGLLAAVREMPSIQLAIKTHPAETPDPYEAVAAGVPNVRVLPASAPLAPLMRACRALVTVNSTVALDGLALGIPALSIGLPNNLSPFVDAGAMAGARTDSETADALERLLYDEEFRRRLVAASASLVAKWRMAPDGRAAERSARAVVALRPSSPGGYVKE